MYEKLTPEIRAKSLKAHWPALMASLELRHLCAALLAVFVLASIVGCASGPRTTEMIVRIVESEGGTTGSMVSMTFGRLAVKPRVGQIGEFHKVIDMGETERFGFPAQITAYVPAGRWIATDVSESLVIVRITDEGSTVTDDETGEEVHVLPGPGESVQVTWTPMPEEDVRPR